MRIFNVTKMFFNYKSLLDDHVLRIRLCVLWVFKNVTKVKKDLTEFRCTAPLNSVEKRFLFNKSNKQWHPVRHNADRRTSNSHRCYTICSASSLRDSTFLHPWAWKKERTARELPSSSCMSDLLYAERSGIQIKLHPHTIPINSGLHLSCICFRRGGPMVR